MMTAFVALVLSSVTILAADDAVCAKAPKGWLRGVVRVTTDKLTATELRAGKPAPKETVAVVRRIVEIGDGFVDGGIVGHAAVDANGAFGISVDSKHRLRLLYVSIRVQMNWTTEEASLTFDPALFKSGLCLEVFLSTAD